MVLKGDSCAQFSCVCCEFFYVFGFCGISRELVPTVVHVTLFRCLYDCGVLVRLTGVQYMGVN